MWQNLSSKLYTILGNCCQWNSYYYIHRYWQPTTCSMSLQERTSWLHGRFEPWHLRHAGITYAMVLDKHTHTHNHAHIHTHTHTHAHTCTYSMLWHTYMYTYIYTYMYTHYRAMDGCALHRIWASNLQYQLDVKRAIVSLVFSLACTLLLSAKSPCLYS